MTFGEKLQKLRKEAGLSQEELAWQLGVSRQAVSKWERGNGYPETEKIIRMGRIFNVTLDYLLNEESTQEPETAAERGIYVSREMADGFLLYQKQKTLKIAAAAGLMVGSLALSFLPSAVSMFLLILIWITGIILLFSVRMTDNPYGKLWQEPLLYDETVKAELNAAYAEKKRTLQLLQLAGIALTASGFLLFPLIASFEFLRTDTVDMVIFAAGLVAAGAGIFLCIYMSGLTRAYRLLVMNESWQQKRK